ncbi:uncharacterized protein SPPG_07403 [Spizellomyces punctatus DAOM BR117]|uniref:RCC1-like domain-containing protein n=1 Tax=Spizellomyces punctatus (strain DAOM BR117) TaxID=645134 RepID=A0A0L0H9Z9_SPIPD|nr:uncharacterized protein SPPG_07403 [Spizellomyces punctatus DAOM BR117]KNC97488.1 hypothetical protein SPPG_07403 [Spizellomyces punctatus DAOM BR117]|eukprot:XP_016605528.1 hypothetical protein SPPG_07403 [Spizellomyces punctatus DAOM BR117]
MLLLAFGSNAHGQLGTGATDDASVPTTCLVPNSLTTSPLCLAGGANHSVIVTADGSLLAAGANDRGQLGIPGTRELHTFSPVAIPIVFPSPVFRYVACGWDHTLALTSDGDLYVFGSNEFGQLGLGVDTKQVDRPMRLDIGTAVEKIAAGMRYSLILTRDQQVWGWGANKYGELGEISKPETINGKGNFPRKRAPSVYYPARLNVPPCSDISCGQHHSILLTRDGRLLGLGRNRHAQLGHSPDTMPETRIPIPISLPADSLPIELFCGWSFTGIRCRSGRVFIWGRNDHNQLSEANDEILSRGGRALQDSTHVACGSEHGIAINQEGRCMAWGWNEHGNCGVGSTTDITEPTVVRDRGVTLVGCGYGHSLIYVHE